MFFIFLTCMSNFVPIKCYLVFDPWTWNFIDNFILQKLEIYIFNGWFKYSIHASIENIWRKCYLMVDLSKFTFYKRYWVEL